MSKRIGALAALAILAMVCSIPLALTYFSASARYQRTGDEAALRVLLADEVHPGEPIDQVTTLLGPAEPDTAYHERLMKSKDGPHFPSEFFPAGIESDDVFLIYRSRPPRPGSFYPLQFRHGNLINFSPSDYQGTNDLITHLHSH